MPKMNFGRCMRGLLGSALAGCWLTVAAQVFDPATVPEAGRYQEPEPPAEKSEMEVTPPAYPKPEALVRFPSDGANQIFLDPTSIKMGDDDILRYTLVVRGAGGAENVTFEAMRCSTGERRVYAYGRRNGTWSPARAPTWIRITDSGINRHYFEFYRDVFCDGKATEPVRVIVRNLTRGGRGREYVLPSP